MKKKITVKPIQPKAPGADCINCPLQFKECAPPITSTVGIDAIYIGEAPGREEAFQNKPFVGQSGKILDAAIKRAGGDPDRTHKTNVVLCWPEGNKAPSDLVIQCCSQRLAQELDSLPNVPIITLGNTACNALDVLPTQKITQKQGQIITQNGRRYHPTFHPAYVSRKPSLLTTLINDIRKAYYPPPTINQPEIYIPDDSVDLMFMLDSIPAGAVSYDLETDQLDWHDKPYAGTEGNKILLNVITYKNESDNAISIIIPEDVLHDPRSIQLLNAWYERDDLTIVAHNAKFDNIFLRTIDIDARCDFDTMLAHYCLNETRGTHGLKKLAADYFGMGDYQSELVGKYLNKKTDKYSKIPFDSLCKYAAYDGIITLELYHILKRELIDQGFYDMPFKMILMRASNMLTDVEYRGIKLDVPYMQANDTKITDELAVLSSKLQTLGKVDTLNPNSPKQVANVIYDILKLKQPKIKGQKIKPRSTAKLVLEAMQGKHPFIDALLNYRRIAKIKSSYIKTLIKKCDPNDRLHTTFLIHGTETGRLSSAAPALQTIPRPSDIYGRMIRSAFIADEGKVLVRVDYSQAELRLFAALSKEPYLLDVYDRDLDLHDETAANVFDREFTKENRTKAKNLNFSVIFSDSLYSFAATTGLPSEQALKAATKFRSLMPIASKWKKKIARVTVKRGYALSPFNRRRRFPIITKYNIHDVEKAAVNHPVQGGASDLTLLSACQLHEEGIPIVLLVHDEIIAEVDESEADITMQRMIKVMEEIANSYFPIVPWKADGSIVKRWADLVVSTLVTSKHYNLSYYNIVFIQGVKQVLATWYDTKEKSELMCYHSLHDGSLIMPMSACTPSEFPIFPIAILEVIHA